MLYITRRVGQKTFIGQDITLTVVEINNHVVKLGIEAPLEVVIQRDDCIKVPASFTLLKDFSIKEGERDDR